MIDGSLPEQFVCPLGHGLANLLFIYPAVISLFAYPERDIHLNENRKEILTGIFFSSYYLCILILCSIKNTCMKLTIGHRPSAAITVNENDSIM